MCRFNCASRRNGLDQIGVDLVEQREHVLDVCVGSSVEREQRTVADVRQTQGQRPDFRRMKADRCAMPLLGTSVRVGVAPSLDHLDQSFPRAHRLLVRVTQDPPPLLAWAVTDDLGQLARPWVEVKGGQRQNEVVLQGSNACAVHSTVTRSPLRHRPRGPVGSRPSCRLSATRDIVPGTARKRSAGPGSDLSQTLRLLPASRTEVGHRSRSVPGSAADASHAVLESSRMSMVGPGSWLVTVMHACC